LVLQRARPLSGNVERRTIPEPDRECDPLGERPMTRPRDRFSEDWNALGQKNPYGAILTGATGELADWTLDEFLATGRADAARFVASLDRIAPASRRHRLLDFGCGVGRVSRALANHFQSVVGVDAAESMIAHARSLHAACPNCEFVVNP